MRMFDSAIRTAGAAPPMALLPAAIVTALLPPVAAGLYRWLVPAGCDMGLEAATYRWTCLFPGLLFVVPTAIALLLGIVSYLNQRLGRRLPDGWLVTAAAAGLITQIVLLGSYLLILEPAYRGSMLGELLLIPQPFVAGAVAGAVFWITLNAST